MPLSRRTSRTNRTQSDAGFGPQSVAEQLNGHPSHKSGLRATAVKQGVPDISGAVEGPRPQRRELPVAVAPAPANRRRSHERKKSLSEAEEPGQNAIAEESSAAKPTISFASLIKEAILSSPHQRLLLHEIYDAVQRKYPYFQTAGEGWKNSIRHNLSINAMFVKVPRGLLEEQGPDGKQRGLELGQKKGCYWIVKDMGTGFTGAAGFDIMEAKRRRTLHHLFARSSSLSAGAKQHDLIHIMPFTQVPMVHENGYGSGDGSGEEGGSKRRMSESAVHYMPYAQEQQAQSFYPGYPTSYEMVWTPTNTVAQQPYYSMPTNFPAYVDYQQVPFPAAVPMEPMTDIQPLPIEPQMGFEGEQQSEMPWLATSPTMSQTAMHEPFIWPSQPQQQTMPWASSVPAKEYQPTMRERRASQVGPGTLPRRNPKDIWLSDITPSSSTQENPS